MIVKEVSFSRRITARRVQVFLERVRSLLPFFLGLIFATHTGLLRPLAARPQADEAPKADTFFAGIVIEYAPEKITISRAVLGKTEKRSFRLTPETQVDGRLRMRVRVTVRYFTDDDGDTATLIVVRPQPKKK